MLLMQEVLVGLFRMYPRMQLEQVMVSVRQLRHPTSHFRQAVPAALST
jgi:hypothetical protein